MENSLQRRLAGLLVVLFLAGCRQAFAFRSPAAPDAQVPATQALPEGRVVFWQSASASISGQLDGHGKTAVLLAGKSGATQAEWSGFARVLAGEGFTTLTVSVPEDESAALLVVGHALDYLYRRGFGEIICIGSSYGADGCADNAGKPGLAGLVLLSYHASADLSKAGYPKLFIAAELDRVYRPQTEQGYQAAAQPKALVIASGSTVNGLTVLDASENGDLQATITDFVEQCSGQ